MIASKYAESSQTTQYTASGLRGIIDKFTAYNGTAAGVSLAVNIVTAAGVASAANLMVLKTISPGETYTFPEVVGHILNAGDFVSTIASAATSLVIRAGGREIS